MIEHRFLVMSAFQALNAAEARHHFDLDDDRCELVVLVPPLPRTRAETDRVVELGAWSHVRVAGPPAASVAQWVRRVRRHRGLRDESADLQTLFLGDYATQLMRNAAHGLRGGEAIVLDDGAVTIRVARHRAARVSGGEAPRLQPQVARSRWEIQQVAGRMLGLRLGDVERLTFFTLYDIVPTPPDTVVRNRFEWLRRLFGPPTVEGGALFVGTPVVDVGIVEYDSYVTMLRRLREHAGGSLLYRPHPREDRAGVERLVADVGMELLHLGTIVEVGLCERGRVPRLVVANHSSSIDSLRVILGDIVSVCSIPLPPSVVARPWRDFIAQAYRDMDARLGVPVERLELLSSEDRR